MAKLHVITCPSPGHALMLSAILDNEGHPSYWTMQDGRPTVTTMAPAPTVRKVISTFTVQS